MPGDAFVSFVFCALIFALGLCLVSAATAHEHATEEKIMCKDLPSMCPCNARNLQVTIHAGDALECGGGQARADMSTLPIIKPPTNVTLLPNALYTVMIIDRDPPSRNDPKARYWQHGLYSDITPADMHDGNIANGVVHMTYVGPSPPPGSGAHSYQILLLKQCKQIEADDMQGVPTVRMGFDAQHFLNTNKMCWPGELIGSFEFTSSDPDGLDGVNPDRLCPRPSESTTTSIASSSSFRRCDILLASVAAFLFRAWLV